MFLKKFLKNQSGSSAVEFSILAAPAFLCIFGAIETSRYFWAYSALQETATDAARCVALRTINCSSDQTSANTTLIEKYIKDQAKIRGIDPNKLSVSILDDAPCRGSSNFSSVTITFDFNNIYTMYQDKTINVSGCFPNQ